MTPAKRIAIIKAIARGMKAPIGYQYDNTHPMFPLFEHEMEEVAERVLEALIALNLAGLEGWNLVPDHAIGHIQNEAPHWFKHLFRHTHLWQEYDNNFAKRECVTCGRREWLFERPFPSTVEPSQVWKRAP
jgi:hypothetical protein